MASGLTDIRAGNVRATSTGVDGAVDVDLVVRLPSQDHRPGRLIEVEVTLMPGDFDPTRYVAWGAPDNWVSGKALAELYAAFEADKDGLREALSAIEGAASRAAGAAPR